jgi:hypothetical protein
MDYRFAGDPMKVCRPNGDIVDFGASAGTKVEITPVVDISAAVPAGEILFDFIAFEALSAEGRVTMLQDLMLVDKEDNTAWSLTLLFADSSISLGSLNAAPSITDANALKLLGLVQIATTDWIDIGGAKVAFAKNIGLVLEAASGTQCYVAGFITAGGTGATFTNASSLQLRAGLLLG